MTTELTMPQMGYDMQEGVIVRWLKAEGDTVRAGEPIAEIETDKAVVEFEAYTDGILQQILVSEGYSVPVGQPIAIIGLHATAPEGHAIEAMNGPSTPLVVSAPEPEIAPEPSEPEPESHPSRSRSPNRLPPNPRHPQASSCAPRPWPGGSPTSAA